MSALSAGLFGQPDTATPPNDIFEGFFGQPGNDHGDAIAGELAHIIRDAAANAPRSLQTTIGPSEVGHPCDRRVAYKLLDWPEANTGSDPLAAIIGTGFHAWAAEAFSRPELGGRWLVEQRLTIAPPLMPGGSCDLYDTLHGRVIDWKGLALDTPLPTPNGWTTIGAVQPGDQVLGADGRPCTVVRKSPIFQRPCYRITFGDSATIVADNMHEWPMLVGPNSQPTLLSTQAASTQIFNSARRPQRQLRIANTEPLSLPDADLPIAPYVLGAWLGDGNRSSGAIGKPDDELFQHIAAEGYQISAPHGKRGLLRTVYGLTTQLRKAELIGHKLIPAEYLRGSVTQRLALLQGLMDTDGTWNQIRRQAIFTSTDKALAESVAELVHSLGWKARVFPLTKHGFGLTITAYDVVFTPHDMNPFRLSRKANLVRIAGSQVSRRRHIRSIEQTITVPTQCIEVDSTDHTYLCGDQMIPTHNCVGTTSLNKYKKDGPRAQYVVQAHMYGLGWELAGHTPKEVALAFVPRTGYLSGLWVWTAPYDRTIATRGLARLYAIRDLIIALDPEAHPAMWSVIPALPDHGCTYCPWYRPGSTDLGAGCPGNLPPRNPHTA